MNRSIATILLPLTLLALAPPAVDAAPNKSRIKKFENRLVNVRKQIKKLESELKQLRKKQEREKNKNAPTTSPGLKKAEAAHRKAEAAYDVYRAERLGELAEISELYRASRDRVERAAAAVAALKAEKNARRESVSAAMRVELKARADVKDLEQAHLKNDEKLAELKDEVDLASYKVQSERKKIIEAARSDPTRERITVVMRGIQQNKKAEAALIQALKRMKK